MKKLIAMFGLCLAISPAFGSCESLKAELAANLDAKGVVNYTLTIVPNEEVKEGDKVIGTCEGDTKKIVYKRD
jgi:hypothetical protein